MRSKRIFALILSMLVWTQLMLTPVSAQQEPDVAVQQGCLTLDAQVPLTSGEQVLATAESVILYEMNSETMVYAWNPDERLDPSGMNKIMTALLAIELGDLDEIVTVTRYALDSVKIGAVSAGLKAGEEISLRDLLYCMMVKSANDAAAVIGDHIGKKIGPDTGKGLEAFVERMNQRALELGCSDTRFMNPTGLSHESQYSTARDLAKITRAALDYESFVELFCAEKYTVPATNKSEERQLVTSNYLTSKETVKNQYDERVTGGKTGARTTTDRSLISTAEVGPLRYLSVVMSAQGTVTADGYAVKTYGSFEETRALLDHGFGKYTITELLREQKVMEQFPVNGGENDVVVCPAVAVSAALPVDANPLDVTYRCVIPDGGLTAPLKKGQTVGTVEIWFRSVCVGQCDLIAMYDVDQPGVNSHSMIPTADEEAKHIWITILLIGGIAVVAVFILWCIFLLLRRKLRIMKVERRRRLIEEGPKKKRSKK